MLKENEKKTKSQNHAETLEANLQFYHADANKEERRRNHLCKVCFYVKEMPAPSKKHLRSTCAECAGGAEQGMLFCASCASQFDACVHCGAKEDVKDTTSCVPKDDWLRSKMADATFDNHNYVMQAEHKLKHYRKDVSLLVRRHNMACRSCYYIDRSHSIKEHPIKKMRRCLGCDKELLTPKQVNRTYCVPCATEKDMCKYCGVKID